MSLCGQINVPDEVCLLVPATGHNGPEGE